MSEVFNLDQFVPQVRHVQYQGVVYEVAHISFSSFMKFVELEEKSQQGAAAIEAQLDAIATIIPDLPPELLKKMPIPVVVQLFMYLIEVIRESSEVEKVDQMIETIGAEDADQGNAE